MDKETYGLVQDNKAENDFELVSKNVASSNYEIGAPVTAKEKPKASKLQGCFVGVATITGLLALAVAVAAIVLVVFFPSLTSNVDEQIQKQAAEIGNLKEMLNRLQSEELTERGKLNQSLNDLANIIQDLGHQLSMLQANDGEYNIMIAVHVMDGATVTSGKQNTASNIQFSIHMHHKYPYYKLCIIFYRYSKQRRARNIQHSSRATGNTMLQFELSRNILQTS